jgi:hypothetical protein
MTMAEWLEIKTYRPSKVVGYVRIGDDNIYGPNKEVVGELRGEKILKGDKEVAMLGNFRGMTVTANLDNVLIGLYAKGRLCDDTMSYVAKFDTMQLFQLGLLKDPRLERIACAALAVLVLKLP